MSGERFKDLVALMARLRAPGGCPWDREQTFETIKPFLLEETYEVVDAIDQRNFEELKGELGDLLLQIVFFSQMAAEEGKFTVDEVIERIYTKMVRRHPHVFGEAEAANAAEVLRRWNELKAEEQRQHAESRGEEYRPSESLLDGVAEAIPSLIQSYQLQSRAAFVGFDWPEVAGVLDKLEEEIRELREALVEGNERRRREKIADEIGDILFSAVNIARFLKVEPESALRRTNQKFRQRFQCMEAKLAERGRKPAESNLDEMEELWQACKRQEPGA